ncbi:hypothetical protein DI392_05065 [Vibrio albus]|uniref:Tetratricopeptide repeat protein n=2 Tax=Vibrio albus TaxID=2200953 RepID=A0A2U3BCG4_9VIBR|nr:hypothetical protein DI392_05065 [Vibrio albus]
MLVFMPVAIFTPFYSWAEIPTSPILDEAEKLVDIAPARAKQITQNYLSARKLVSDSQEISASRENAEKTIRTPNTTVIALQVLARSRLALKDARGALNAIDEAVSVAQHHTLSYARLQSQMIKTGMLWKLYKDKSKVSAELDTTQQDIKSGNLSSTSRDALNYQLTMLRGTIASESLQLKQADSFFQKAEKYASGSGRPELFINYQLTLGEHNLNHHRLNRALYDLLAAYWSAIESNNLVLLARSNHLLAMVFYQRQALDRSIEHLLQAADFYDKYKNSAILPVILKQMGDIYYLQSKFNLALVHYFNVLDAENTDTDIEHVINLRLDLAKTYIQLFNYPLAEQYLNRAHNLLSFSSLPQLQAKAILLEADLAFHLGRYKVAIAKATLAQKEARKYDNPDIRIQAHHLLASSYAKTNQYQNAYEQSQLYSQLQISKKDELLRISIDNFIQQKKFIESSLHYQDQQDKLSGVEAELHHYQNILMALFAISSLLLFFVLRKATVSRRLKKELTELYEDHYTHPRSGLRNLRLLNLKLPSSLEQSNANFEQWETGELINEPLHDRLRFIMIDLPFLRNMYPNGGYKAGLELESEFGAFIKSKIVKPARLYHFSDALFLYVEPNPNPDKDPEQIFYKVTDWIDQFKTDKKIDKCIRAGIADYPFLQRAYTAIDDKDLIDILLMASNMARDISLENSGSQWVYLKAIKNAPAASFAGDNIRIACRDAIDKGLIKVISSRKNGGEIKKTVLTD